MEGPIMYMLGLFLSCLFAQQPAMPPADQLYVVNSENAVIRCGGDRNYYAFLEAPPSSLVHIKEQMANWGRISADGPLFSESWGWLRLPADETGRFEVLDERTGTTLDTMPVFAPDLMNPQPTKAWRPVCMLPMDSQVDIVDSTTENLDGKTFHFYKIRLPRQAEGWINMADVRLATAQEARAWSTVEHDSTIEVTTMKADSPVVVSETESMETLPAPTGQPSYLSRYLQNRRSSMVPDKVVLIEEEPGEEIVINSRPYWEKENHYFLGLERLYSSIPPTEMSHELLSRLWDAYAIVAEEDVDTDPDASQMASIRMRQLELAMCLVDQKKSLNRLESVMKVASSDVRVVRKAIDQPVDYVVMGRLGVSSIFTGNDGRPVMYRVEDPVSGRTLAYIEHDLSVDMTAMIGQWIGVVGPMNFDSRWRVQVIAPQRVDLVAASPF